MNRRISLLLGLALTGCGGGSSLPGGAPGASTASLSGDYHIVEYRGVHGPDRFTTIWGQGMFDGLGTFTDGGYDQNENTVVTMGTAAPPGPYTVSADGTLHFPFGGGGDVWQGGLNVDGSLAAVGTVFLAPGTESATSVMIRKGSGLSTSTLSGDYHTRTIGFNPASPGTHYAIVGSDNFDGAGGFAVLPGGFTNQDGAILPPFPGGPGTYTVSTDGKLVVNGAQFQGGVHPNGEFAIVGGGLTSPILPSVTAWVRASSAATLALFDGVYTFVGLSFNVVSKLYEDFVGTITVGGGFGSARLTITREGTVYSYLTTTLTYTVDPDGTLSVVFPGGFPASLGETLTGAISPTGKMGMLGGGSTAGSDPTLVILIRP